MLSVKTARNKALNEILSFTYPRLHTGSCWYISFYAFDPAKEAMRRKRIKINSVGNAAQKRRYATQVCHRIATQLDAGWNPWVEAEADFCYKLFADALTHYRNHIAKLLADGVHRQTTTHCYTSFAGMLEKWNDRQKSPIRYIYQFDRTFCVRFLDYVYLERKSSPATRNNALAFLRSLSTFLVQHLYLKEKPTAGLQNIRKGAIQKLRTGIDPADMQRLHDWLQKNNRPFLLVCYFLHYMLIRPREIAKLRLQDICVAKQTVYIDASISKNKKSASVTIPVPILELMIDLEYFNAPGSSYIFSEGFRPGAKYRLPQFLEYGDRACFKISPGVQILLPEGFRYHCNAPGGIGRAIGKRAGAALVASDHGCLHPAESSGGKSGPAKLQRDFIGRR